MAVTKLSIIVPSYDRAGKLLETLRALCPQLVPSVTITVLDNCSPLAYETHCLTMESDLARYVEQGSLRFIRNKYNVGMSANFLKAFEICDAEWMWLISDDDRIYPDAVTSILAEIDALSDRPEVAFVKFNRLTNGRAEVREAGVLATLPELIDTLAISADRFNSYIFITNGLYRFPHFAGQIETGYRFLHTYVPHLMMLLHYVSLHDGEGAVFLSVREVAAYVKPEMGYHYGFVAGLGVGAFKNFTFNISETAYEKLECVFAAHNDYKVALDIFYFSRARADMHVVRRLVRNYYLQIRSARSLVDRSLFRCFMLLLYFPGLCERGSHLVSNLSPRVAAHIAEIRKRNGSTSQ